MGQGGGKVVEVVVGRVQGRDRENLLSLLRKKALRTFPEGLKSPRVCVEEALPRTFPEGSKSPRVKLQPLWTVPEGL